MTPSQVAFTRARSPEQKAQRREAILAAARRLAALHGVPATTLGDLADEVGLAKSNVVRYFGTREEIFVELCIDESLALRDALLARLGGARPEEVAGVLADTVGGAPVFCEVVGLLPTHLEHNVSFDAAMRLKVTTAGVLHDVGAALGAAVPGLAAADAGRVLAAATLLGSGYWAAARPSPVVREVYAARPELASALAGGGAPGGPGGPGGAGGPGCPGAGGGVGSTVRDQLEPMLRAMLRGFTSG